MKKLSLLLGLFLAALFVSGQTFEEFKKQREQELQQMKQQRQKELKELKQEYNDYIKQQDKEFAAYLEKEWESFKVFKAQKLKPEPKPNKIPRFEPREPEPREPEQKDPEQRDPDLEKKEQEKPEKERKEETPFRQLKPLGTVTLPEPEVRPENIKPVIQKSIPDDFDFEELVISFYGQELNFSVDPKLKEFEIGKINEDQFSEAWTELSNTQSSKLVKQAYAYKEDMNLNDWALFMLFRKVAGSLAEKKPEQRVLTWFLMNRAGYNARIAYNANDLANLLPSNTEIYASRYLTIDGRKYYLMNDFDGQQMYTYTADYALAHKPLDLYIHKPLLLGDENATRELNFKHNGESFAFEVNYNKNHIAFFNDYPQTDVAVFLNAPASEMLKTSLNGQLKEKVSKLGKEATVNFLLALTQKSFEYKKDPQQFGREKFFFPEEVFHYPYSDCEDRAAIFAYLVRELSDMEVVGLDYPGHLATAVRLGDEAEGNYVTFDDQRYTVADPTYVNAPYGRIMPQFRDSPAKIVQIRPGEMRRAGKFWDMAQAEGAYRASNQKDYAFDPDGNCYLTGFYNKDIQLGNTTLEGSTKKQAFIAQYSPKGKVLWAENLKNTTSDAFSMGNAITILDDGTLATAGIFRGTISVGRRQVDAGDQPAYYVAKYDENHNPRWVKQTQVEEHFKDRRFVTAFSMDGQVTENEYYPGEDVIDTREGLFTAGNKIYLTGTMASVPGKAKKSYASGASMDYATRLKEMNDKLVEENVAAPIAGLFAVIELIKNTGYVIPGAQAQKALDKYNPQFKENNPDLYENISQIKFLKNQEGIVTILSDTKKSVTFDKVKVKHKARLKIEPLPEGNQKIIVLSGMKVGKYFVWYDLNAIKMFRESGDLLFDYDDDHTHKIVSMKEDILN